MINNGALPKNVNDLTELVITQRDQLAHQSLFIDQLLEQIKLAQHHRFGVKSEHISPDQLRLLLDEEQKTVPIKLILMMIWLIKQKQHRRLPKPSVVAADYPFICHVLRSSTRSL